MYNYVYSYQARDWELLGSDDGESWNAVDSQLDPPCDHVLKSYAFAANTTQAYRQYKILILRNKGYTVTWLPEFYPYICNTGFDRPLYFNPHLSLNYNHPFELHALFTSEEVEANHMQFEVSPPFPATVSLDPYTGVIRGAFVGLSGSSDR